MITQSDIALEKARQIFSQIKLDPAIIQDQYREARKRAQEPIPIIYHFFRKFLHFRSFFQLTIKVGFLFKIIARKLGFVSA